MRLTEVTYSTSRKLQVKQYEPVEYFYSATAEVGEGEDPKEVYKALETMVDEELKKRTIIYDSPGKVVRAKAKELTPF